MDYIDINKTPEYQDHEQVVDLSEDNSGISGYIAVHNTNLGPALGGTRIFNYQDKEQALKDVLRLSRAMTYKCAIAGLPFGGGKGVIIADLAHSDTNAILKSYAEKVSSLKGRFYTGEDVGLSEPQVQYMLQYSPYFIGKTGLAGDPSKYAAMSVFLCIQVALEHLYNNSDITGKKFAIKGVGKTGSELAWLLAKAGGVVFATDIDSTKIDLLSKLHPNIQPVTMSEMQTTEVDVYCPCALGNDIDDERLKSLRAPIVCGTANNQLADESIKDKLFQKGILHIPDYIANAGGLINVADELLPGGYDKTRVLKNINNLKKTLKKVLDESSKQKLNPDAVADAMAEKIFNKQ